MRAWNLSCLPLRRTIALYVVMSLVVLYPVLTVQVPALGDYLNHLARMHILADIGHSEALSKHYQVHWQAIPYLAMDASFVVLNRIASIYNAGRIFVAICVILPVVSVALLHYVVHRRVSLVPLAAFVLCYNDLLSWGFLNFLPALCLAVMLFAGWIGSTRWPRWPRVVLFCLLATGLYLGHLVAFGAYGLAVGGFQLAQSWQAGFRPWRTTVWDWFSISVQALPAAALALAVHIDRPFVGPIPTSFGSVATRVISVMSPVLFTGGAADMLTASLGVAVLFIGLRTCRLRLAPSVWPAAVAVGAVALCMPHWLLGTFNMDVRLPLMVVMLLIGGISTTERAGRIEGCAVLGAFLILTAVRSAAIAEELGTLDRQIAEVRHVVGVMPRGMRLLLVDNSNGPRPGPPWATWHVGMVGVIDRDAFVPNLFTGLATVHPVPELRSSSTPNGMALDIAALNAGLGRTDDPSSDQATGAGGRIYWLGWEHKFDYVLALHFGSGPAVMPKILQMVATSPVADLYRIDQPVTP